MSDPRTSHKMILSSADTSVPVLKGRGEPLALADGKSTAEWILKPAYDIGP